MAEISRNKGDLLCETRLGAYNLPAFNRRQETNNFALATVIARDRRASVISTPLISSLSACGGVVPEDVGFELHFVDTMLHDIANADHANQVTL